jgi:hypothetical protein
LQARLLIGPTSNSQRHHLGQYPQTKQTKRPSQSPIIPKCHSTPGSPIPSVFASP